MSDRPRVFVDFQEAKRVVSVPDVLAGFDLLDQFTQRGSSLAGGCPLPAHQHGPRPNPEQFKAHDRDSVWLWHCFGDCQRGGDSIELAKLLTGFSNQHIRWWLVEHFGERLTLSRNKKRNGDSRKQKTNGNGQPDAETKTAREEGSVPQRASANVITQTVSSDLPPIKPLRFKLKLETPVPYLADRGVSDETVARYGLGLCTKGMLKGYLAIPVYGPGPSENPVAYLGRWPGDDYDADEGRPRYRWPKDFKKERIVYGLAEALETPDGTPLVCVEGPFGLYRVVQAGFPGTVAICGSDLSDEQAGLLIATGRPLVLMFDGDEAGRSGMRKAAGKLIPHTFVRVVKLAENVQPDDLSATDLHSLLSPLVKVE